MPARRSRTCCPSPSRATTTASKTRRASRRRSAIQPSDHRGPAGRLAGAARLQPRDRQAGRRRVVATVGDDPLIVAGHLRQGPLRSPSPPIAARTGPRRPSSTGRATTPLWQRHRQLGRGHMTHDQGQAAARSLAAHHHRERLCRRRGDLGAAEIHPPRPDRKRRAARLGDVPHLARAGGEAVVPPAR